MHQRRTCGEYPDERYRREARVGIEAELDKQAGVDDQRAADDQDGVAVAGALATSAVPMLPLAPGWFST
jgi:hypothetical protein